MTTINYAGKRFVRLTAISKISGAKKATWLCRCDCGRMVNVRAGNLQSGNSKSCGCIMPDVACGWVNTPEYTAFKNARNRCERPKDIRFADYGGRGIQFHFRNMAEFIAAVGPRPSNLHSLDRIDPNGHYEPGNLRWAPLEVQARNKRTSLLVAIDGVTKPLKEWCAEADQPYKRVWERIKNGVAPEVALRSPPGPTAHRNTAQTVVTVEAIHG